jgi:hypothetical protein
VLRELQVVTSTRSLPLAPTVQEKIQDNQFLDGWALARHMGIADRPFMVDFDTSAEPWSWRKDRFTPRQLAELWARQLTLPEVSRDYPVGLYVHIPFCTHTCSFCRCSRQQLAGRSVLDQYVDFLCAQMDFFAPTFAATPMRYFSLGGGTPTILDPKQLTRLFQRLYQRFDIRPSPLSTVEMSAPTMRDEVLKTLVDNGVPRISVGVQTLQPEIRRASSMFQLEPTWLGRRVENALKLGMHVNLDLVLGLPDEPAETFVRGFETLLAMQPSSIIINLLNANYFDAISEADATRGRAMADYLRAVGEGVAQAAARVGYVAHPHSNTIEAIAFFSPDFAPIAVDNWQVLKRLASGVLSVNVGTSVFALGSLCNLALLPDYLLGCFTEDYRFDPDTVMYQCSRKEIYSILYPKDEDRAPSFDPQQRRVIERVAASLSAMSSRVTVMASEDELLLEFFDADQEEHAGRVFLKASGAARHCYKKVGTFELSFNGTLSKTMTRVLQVLERELAAAGSG